MDAELVTWRERVGVCADSQLMAELQKFVRIDRRCEARVLLYLGEVDARELFLAEGFASLFRYTTAVLRMSGDQAYLRIQAARLARRYPVILEMLVQGELNLSTLKVLDRHLTVNNHMALLERARNKTKSEVQLLVAEIAPQPDVPNQMRNLPARSTSKRAKAAGAQVQAPFTHAQAAFAHAQAPSARMKISSADMHAPSADMHAPSADMHAPSARMKTSTADMHAPSAMERAASADTFFVPATGGAERACGAVAQSSLLAQQAKVEQAPVACDGDEANAVAAEVGKPVPSAFSLEAPRASLTALRPGYFKLQITAGQALRDN